MSLEEKVLVAESCLETAAIELQLAKKLAALKTSSSPNAVQTSKNDIPNLSLLMPETAFAAINFNNTYLAGKMLIESGTKVQFDGNPKNYIAFIQGMDRVMSMHVAKFGLIHDILQSRYTGKASEAIKFCYSIKDPQKAVETALGILKNYFGNEAAIVVSITKNEMVKWNPESFQSFLNKLENIKALLYNDSHKKTINSPNVIKGIISRMPERSRDELVKILCTSDQHLPSFTLLLQFIEKQLKLVSHPVANILPVSETKSKAGVLKLGGAPSLGDAKDLQRGRKWKTSLPN